MGSKVANSNNAPQFYNGNPNVKAAGAQHQYTGQEINDFIKCSQDPLYFMNNFVKVVSLDGGLVPFKTYPYQNRVVSTIHNNRFTIAKIFRQSGKSLPIEVPIATPTGFKPMGEIRVGDYVIGSDGKPVEVTFESEIQYPQLAKITFDNGQSIVSSIDHLWTVHDRIRRTERVLMTEQERSKYKNTSQRFKYVPPTITLTVGQMIERGYKKINSRGYYEYNFYIDNTKPIDVPDDQLIIDPYCLGLWLGDGFSSSAAMCGLKQHIEWYQHQARCFKDQLITPRDHPNMYNASFDPSTGLTRANLTAMNLLNNKHIPDRYIFCSKQSKIRLLQGLIDTDGWIDKKRGTCHLQFSRKYQQMIETVPILLNSLGLKVTTRDFEGTNSRRFSFMVTKDMFVPATLPDKVARVHDTQSSRSRYWQSRTIVDIELLEQTTATKCIEVDSEDHLYLAGDIFVPTHNTTVVAAYCLWYAIFNELKNVVILANKQSTAREILSRIQQQYEDLPDFVKPGVKEYNKLSLVFDNGSKIKCAATSASAIRGQSVNLLVLDEAAFIPDGVANEFITSVFPTLSNSKTSKMVLISTPYGMNHFYKIWREAEQGKNGFVPIDGHWTELHDQQWFKEQSMLLGDPIKVAQEIECVDGDTIVDVFNTATGKCEKIAIADLYNRLAANQQE